MKSEPARPVTGGKIWLCASGILAGGLSIATPARASTILSVQSTSALDGSTGNHLEVSLTNTGSAAISIESFTFDVSTVSLGINFTEATSFTIDPYIFAGESAFGPDITVSQGQGLLAEDFDFFGGLLQAGATVGLGELSFNVASSVTPGQYSVTVDTSLTSLGSPSGSSIPIDKISSGVITVTGAGTGGGGGATVPEPASILLVSAGLLSVATRRKRGFSAD